MAVPYGTIAATMGFPRWTTLATMSGGAWGTTDYGITNATSLPLSKVCRSQTLDSSDTTFTATLSKPRRIQMMAIVGHNLTLDATYRITIYDTIDDMNVLYQSDITDVWPVVYDTDLLDWEDDNWWSGKYTQEELEGVIPLLPIYLDTDYFGQVIVVELFDDSNPDGYVQFGFFEIAQAWTISVSFEPGASYGFRIRTRSTEHDGGGKSFERQAKPLVFRGRTSFMPRDEAMFKAFEQMKRYDIDTPFIWMPHPDEQLHLPRNAFLAQNVDPGMFAYSATGFNSNEVLFNFEQVMV